MMGTYPPSLGAAGPWRCPEKQVLQRADSMSPSQSAVTQRGWGFHTLRGGIDPGICVFDPMLLKLYRYGNISGPGRGTYPPRVRRDLGVVPRSNPRRALAP